MAHR
jgi:hypothetical protein